MPELIVRKWDGPYSFMVFREYGVYRARRGDTGEVQFEDPDAGVVVLNAIKTLINGGRIFLRNDEYNTVHEVICETDGIEIIGESKEKTIWNYTGAGDAFIFRGTPITGVALKNMTIQSNGEDEYAIKLESVVSSLFENLYLYNHGGRAIYCDAGDYEFKFNVFRRIEINSCGYGITLDSTGSTRCNANRFYDIRCWGITNRGIEIINSKGDTNVFVAPALYGCPFFIDDWHNFVYGLRFEGSGAQLQFGSHRAKYNIIHGDIYSVTDPSGPVEDNILVDTKYGLISPHTGQLDSFVRVYLTSAQNITANTDTIVAFNNVDVDVRGEWDPATYQFSPDYDGEYEVILAITFAVGADGDRYEIKFRNVTNGVNLIEMWVNASGATNQMFTVSKIVRLTSGKSYAVQVKNKDNNDQVQSAQRETWLTIRRLSY